MRRILWAGLTAAILASAADCRRTDIESAAGGKEKAASIPVQTAPVTVVDLAETVSAPGHTVALSQLKIRSPFAGTLTELNVVDGDPVKRGDLIGAVVSRDTEAALSGAEAMERDARTPAEQKDARRAVDLARSQLVKSPLRSFADGVVISHTASAGDRVSEDQEIVVVSEEASLVFQADVGQSDLPRVRSGQKAVVLFSGSAQPTACIVHGILSSANPSDLTVPVRLDMTGQFSRRAVGLFGTATITVAQRRQVRAVPVSAVIRDDVTGVARLAVVTPDQKSHWLVVKTGLSGRDVIEVVEPQLPAGQPVIVSGQVGLPEATPVAVKE